MPDNPKTLNRSGVYIYNFLLQFDLQLVNNIYPVMTKDSLVTSHAISTQIVHPDDITAFFDSISYDKVYNLIVHITHHNDLNRINKKDGPTCLRHPVIIIIIVIVMEWSNTS